MNLLSVIPEHGRAAKPFDNRRRSLGPTAWAQSPFLLVLLVAAFGFGLAPSPATGQTAAVQGIVAESEAGRPLEDVVVTLEVDGEQAYSALTDRNGFFQIPRIQPGSYTLSCERIGFARYEQALVLAEGQRVSVNVRMDLAAIALEGIVVSPERGAAVQDLGRQTVAPDDIRMVPVPGGSGDLASYLQTLPGVTTSGDRGGQLYVRGGTSAENLVLVDGIPIYQPFHVLGFFSVFPEEVVSRADFYPGGFGARYQGRTSSTLDVRIRDGDPQGFSSSVSASPFLAEALVEGATEGATWIGFTRRSLVEETSESVMGTTQPLTFESQLFKVTSTHQRDDRCSLLGLRTKDRGRLDPEDRTSQVAWSNRLLGLRCVSLRPGGQLVEIHWSYSGSDSEAVSRGSSNLTSNIWRVQHDLHATGRIGSIPVQTGYKIQLEGMGYEMAELFSDRTKDHTTLFGVSTYLEPALTLGERIELRPGLALTVSPSVGLEPRVRGSWKPFSDSGGALQGSFGLYRQHVVGVSDMRDVGSVFVAWMKAPDGEPLEALQASLGWQQPLGGGFRWSVDGYVKRLSGVPVPIWRGVAEFTTDLGRADGEVHGADVRVEVTKPGFYGFLGYGYSWTLYKASQTEFGTWFGEPVQEYHPPHDRRHQVNAVMSLDLSGFRASARWQFGSGLPFTRPMGFDETFNYGQNLHDVQTTLGTTRLVLDKPLTGRLPMIHRLDLSVKREFDLSLGRLSMQAGVINAYDRENMFYYDLFSGRRLDQLPLAPYASLAFRSR